MHKKKKQMRQGQGELHSKNHSEKTSLKYTKNCCQTNSIITLATQQKSMCFTKRAQCSAITSNYDIGIFKEPIDKGHEFDVLLKDLSKTFDFIDHKLLIARLYSYGISLSSFNLVSFYLNNQTQRIKINDCFNLRHELNLVCQLCRWYNTLHM